MEDLEFWECMVECVIRFWRVLIVVVKCVVVEVIIEFIEWKMWSVIVYLFGVVMWSVIGVRRIGLSICVSEVSLYLSEVEWELLWVDSKMFSCIFEFVIC